LASTSTPTIVSHDTVHEKVLNERRYVIYNSRRLSGECLSVCTKDTIHGATAPTETPRGATAPTSAPRIPIDDSRGEFDCDDSTNFLFDGIDGNNCEWVGESETTTRCNMIQTEGQPGAGSKVNFFCPRICEEDECKCIDSTTFKFRGWQNKDCNWIAAKKTEKRCDKTQGNGQPFDGQKVSFFCPDVCKEECQ